MLNSSQRILLVDDDDADRIVVKFALSKAKRPMVISEVRGFEEATQLLTKEQFDCVLLDYHLGDQDGLGLIKEIHSESLSDAAIVMLSDMDDEPTMLSCLKEGAQDFLLKSEITTNTLVRAIRYAEERKNITLKMRYMAQHDSLTDLSNRSLFVENVKRAIIHSCRTNTSFAIIFIDLDNFKSINDTFGHEAGDELLITIARRIKQALREEDVVGRLGGDEFAVLIEGIVSEASLIQIAQKLLNMTKDPLVIADKTIYSSASLGIATYPNCANEATELIKCADIAMYKAKKSGRNSYCFYSKDLQVLADDFTSFKNDIHNALTHGEFELYYQPQVSTSDSTLIGVEALIRWFHPTKGFVSPDQFIPIAESLGLINEIGDWVIEEACSQLKNWMSSCQQLHQNFKLAINISAHQIRQLNLEDKLCRELNNNNIPYELIELELTESVLIEDLGRCAEVIGALENIGFQFAIDDFGTGFASFQHLQQLPVKSLKINKSFIDHICSSKKSYEIVKSMIVMAHALEMKVVAEGVERMEQVKLLRMLACDSLQGYYFGRPLPAQKIDKLLADPKYCDSNKIYYQEK